MVTVLARLSVGTLACVASATALALPAAASLLDSLAGASGATGYALLALLVLAGGVGLPVPEEAVLAMAGWLSAEGRLWLPAAWFTCWVAIVGWDVAVHSIGRVLGPRLAASRVGRRIGPRRIAAARRFFRRHGLVAVAVARFVMGTRNATYLVAGATGMPLGRFLAVVAPVGVVSTGIPFFLGFHLGDDLHRLLARMRVAEWVVVALAAVAVVVLVVAGRKRRRRAKAAP